MTSLARATLLPLLLTVGAHAGEKNSSLAKDSPFSSPAAAGTAQAASETIELAGVSSIGKRTDLIFYDKTTKKSHWIGIGETKEGIAVISYDVRREQAQVKLNGAEKTLPLRKVAATAASPRPVVAVPSGFNNPSVGVPPSLPPPTTLPPAVVTMSAPASQPAAAPTPVAPPPAVPLTPEAQTQAKQETEARMLVSDLLEIGMAQRKAYEEQQRKAAEGAPQTPPATATAAPTTPAQPPKS